MLRGSGLDSISEKYFLSDFQKLTLFAEPFLGLTEDCSEGAAIRYVRLFAAKPRPADLQVNRLIASALHIEGPSNGMST